METWLVDLARPHRTEGPYSPRPWMDVRRLTRSSWFYFGVAVISDPRLVVVQKGSVMECMRNEDGYNESEVGKPFLMQCRVWLDSPIKRLADAEIYSV